MNMQILRRRYHESVCASIIRVSPSETGPVPNFADKGSATSIAISQRLLQHLGYAHEGPKVEGQTAGGLFEKITMEYLRQAFGLLAHLRPGSWDYQLNNEIALFDQYAHLADITSMVKEHDELAASLGQDYIVRPDITIARLPVSDEEINLDGPVLESEGALAALTPLRDRPPSRPLLHASISCKWTLRSDRAQNARTEALNLVRNRKGSLPHVLAVTAEPMPTRIASLALGTGDLDCVYHFALHELEMALRDLSNEDQLDMLHTMTTGRRLRDISDLPFDLAI